MVDHPPEASTGTPITPPAHFPVHWDDEVESTLLWSWDDFHYPLPPSRMASAVGKLVRTISSQASKDTGTYRPGGRSKIINGYPYGASTALPLTEDEKAARQSSLDRQIETVRANWDESWLPELKADLEGMKQVRYGELDAAGLWRTVEKALELDGRHWYIHNMVVSPVIEQSNRLEKICSQMLEPTGLPDVPVVPTLLHGVETLTVRSVKRLELLAEQAGNTPDVRRTLERELSAGEMLAALDESEPGRAWRAALDDYLYEYGYRGTSFDLSFTTWVEDQTLAFQVIRSLMGASETAAPSAESRERALDRERDALLAKVREAGTGNPELLQEFNKAYEMAQRIWPLKEDHSHYIDQGSLAMVRLVLAEVGRRLAASEAIERPEDIWYLDLDEAKAAFTGELPAGLRDLVTERRADKERFSKLTPPKYLGTFPPDHDDSEEASSPVETSGTLRGTAASKGGASGIARVVLSPDDFHKVRRGDVLVCRSTAPMWTPLFRVISALVSETGGVLSHPAVVAREFNLPAVVGVPLATSLILDGQPVTVSGTDGLVHTG